MRILEGQGITKNFGGLTALASVDFHIDRGEILGLIGPNGAGKTTLFNLISGSLVPTPGTQKFKGLSEMKESLAKDLTIINQKRLEVARALATKPELLMLDEFMAGLNPTEVVLAIGLIKKKYELGMTIFMIENLKKD